MFNMVDFFQIFVTSQYFATQNILSLSHTGYDKLQHYLSRSHPRNNSDSFFKRLTKLLPRNHETHIENLAAINIT